MASGKEIRAQIKSISNTRKITSAMEMVAASKMRKAQDRMAASRPYSDKMRQVLLNVLLNAAQSIESDGAITIEVAEADGLAAVSVRDTGCGMSEEQAAQAFTPFFTTKEKGTGLGLAVAQKIVEGHGGRIELESEVGAGTTMIVYLPVAE